MFEREWMLGFYRNMQNVNLSNVRRGHSIRRNAPEFSKQLAKLRYGIVNESA